MRSYAGKIMQWTLFSLVVVILYIVSVTPWQTVQAALTITSSVITDWTAVAEGATGESAVITLSSNYATEVHIQAFLDMNDAHEGTGFSVQVSGNSSGDEDWTELYQFKALVGTSDAEPIDDDPLSSTSTTVVVSNTGGGYETEPMGKWIAIEDGTLVNSELVWITGFTTDTNFTIQDGTTNEHAVSTLVWDIAISKTIMIPFGAGARARVICNNGCDLDGTASSLNWKVGKTVTTALD